MLCHDDSDVLEGFQRHYHNYVYDSAFARGQCGGDFAGRAAGVKGGVSAKLQRVKLKRPFEGPGIEEAQIAS